MEYVIPVVLVLLIAGAAAAAFVMNARQKTASGGSGPSDRLAEDHQHSGGPGIGADSTPLADTAEHAGENTTDGRTVGGQDAERYGGTGRPLDHYGATVPEERIREAEDAEAAERQRAPGSTEPGQGGTGGGDPSTPESERIADRPS